MPLPNPATTHAIGEEKAGVETSYQPDIFV